MSREQQKQQTRETLLATAERLFKQRGYNQVSTRLIAKEANVAVGTVFSHFSDKASLTKALFHNKMDHQLARISSDMPEGLSGKAFFYFYAQHLYQLYAQDRQFSIALLQNSLFEFSYFQAQMDSFIQMVAEQISADSAELSQADRMIIAKAYFSFYLTRLVTGLNNEASTPDQWLAGLQQDCEQLWEATA